MQGVGCHINQQPLGHTGICKYFQLNLILFTLNKKIKPYDNQKTMLFEMYIQKLILSLPTTGIFPPKTQIHILNETFYA